MANVPTDKPTKLERTFLLGGQTADFKEGLATDLLAELRQHVENLRIAVMRTELVRLVRGTPAILFGIAKAHSGARFSVRLPA